MTHFKLRLYIAGRTAETRRAVENLVAICNDDLGGAHEIEVVDVLENASLARHDGVLATPTLVRLVPEPVRRLLGNLSDREKVLVGIDAVPLTEDQH